MKIAIIKLSSLGDIIHTVFILGFIKKSYPNAKIDWFVQKGFEGILEYNPYIDNICIVDLKSVKSRFFNIFTEIKKLKKFSKNNYDMVIDFQALIKSAVASRILGEHVIGFSSDSIKESFAARFYSETYAVEYSENTIKRYAFLCSKALEIEIDINSRDKSLFYSNNDLSSVEEYFVEDKKNIVFIIGSTWESRNYPKEKFVELAKKIDANILIPFGNSNEYKDAKYIEKKSTNVTVVKKLNLNELKALISNTSLVIGGDTGPTYIAWANFIPVLVLFGPTPVSRIYTNSKCKVLKSSSYVNPLKLNKTDFSIKELKVKEILQEIDVWLR